MDENLLFTAEILTLNGDLVFSRVSHGQHVIKNVSCQGYLTVDDAQLRVLYYFQSPKTVPAALEEMIRDRTCLSFRDFYELVLKAHQVGILRNAKTKEIRTAAVRWLFELNARWTMVISACSLLAVLGFLLWQGAPWPARWEDWFFGWLFTGLFLSLGEVFSAAVLRRAGGEIYRPRFVWRTLIPRFSADLRDAILVSRSVHAAVEITRPAPLALGLFCLLFWWPSLAFVPACALAYRMRPVGRGLVGELCGILRFRRILSSETNHLYQPNRAPSHRLRHEWRQFEWRMVLFQFIAAVLWVACLGRIAYQCLGFPLHTALPSVQYWVQALVLVIAATLVAALLFVFFLFLSSVLALAKATRWKWSRRLGRLRFKPKEGSRLDNPSALIRENQLLRKLDYSTQQDLAKMMKTFKARTWQTIIEYDEQPAFVGIIVSGSLTAFRRNKSGRRSKYMLLGEGDLFGAHALVDPYNSRMELRTNTPLHALIMPVEDFRTLVVTKLGKNAVYESTQKQIFLRRLPLCSGWKPHVVSRFAQIAQVVQYKPTELIVRQGGEARAFYLLFEGTARVMRGCQRLSRIHPGDFIGEIGLLQNSDNSADVEAEEDCLALVINKVDFLRFITHNHSVALQIEHIASTRLRRPIYPLDAFSFETQ